MPVLIHGGRRRSGGSLVGVLILLGGCSSPGTIADPPVPAPTQTQTPAQEQTPTPSSPTTVRLSFGGDVMFQDSLETLLEEPEDGLDPIRSEMSSADFTMVNLESSITTRGEPDPKEREDEDNRYHFRSGPEVLTALRAAGVDAVSVANNHGADFGADGLTDTLQAKRSRELPVVGVGNDLADVFTPHRVTLKGQSFAFLAADASFLESTEPAWEAGASTPGLAAARGQGRTALLAAVQHAAISGAAVVVYMHWGAENQADVTAEQKSLARALSRAGAAVVVGSHAHELQGAGWLGPTYVAYGLGNFIWYHGARGGETGLLDLDVRDGEVVEDGWRPAVIRPEGGLPRFEAGGDADAATDDWRDLRATADLSSKPSAAASAPASAPRFTSSVSPLGPAIRQRMSSSYRRECPVSLDDLRYLTLSYWDFDGKPRLGELVVAAEHATAMVTVFGTLYAAEFPIQRMDLVSDFDGNDDESMAANNSSAFNCRPVAGTSRWSEHSFGTAVDLNPVQNPYVTETVAPPAGEQYAQPEDRRDSVKGLITADSVVVEAFRDAGWEWGGSWREPKDFQHFSAGGS